MTILFAANSAAAFDYSQSLERSTNSNFRDTTNGAGGGVLGVPSNTGFAQRDLENPIMEGWLHGMFHLPTPIVASNRPFLVFYDQNGQTLFSILRNDQNTYAQINTGPSTTVNGPNGQFSSAALIALDINFKLHATTGFIKIYASNILIASYSGNTEFFGSGGVAAFRIKEYSQYSTGWFSEIIFADEDTRGMKVKTMFGDAVGTDSGFTGTFSDVSGSLLHQDTTALTTETADVITTFNLAAPPVPSTSIKGVFVSVRGSRGTTGPQAINAALRTGGVTYHSANKPLDAILKSRVFTFPTNPGTGLAWTTAELTALEAGVRSRA
jgi:hypothetical protein